jgi:hypothetical protein
VDSQTPGFDDPQCAFRRPRTEYDEEFSHAIEKGGMCGPRSDLEYHYAGAGGRRVAKHLAKITIQCDERSAFALAHFEQALVCRSPQPLTDNRNGVMAGGTDQIGRAPAEVLIKF